MKRSLQGEPRALFAHADVMLAAAIVVVVGMLVVPLPTFVLDVLLSTNLAVAAILVLVSLYVRKASSLTSLPSILLLTTLFRLSLNVSSTRLILLQADAGAVIDAFGDFVVQGNYVVGAVVFLILTLVQFIVIARGSERVAEVAARFSLDAMPGRQMAIDADLRAGAIDMETASAERAALHRESRFHGAMDGAMKFVKGDAIAGIVITVVNIVGGLAIGVGQRGMEIGEAVQVYTLLTIGDGLVTQIPALVIATAAGIVVTRVAGDSTDLGSDIAGQILEHPRALGFASGLLLLLGLVPGLPFVPFLVLALGVAGVAWFARRRLVRRPEERFAPLVVRADPAEHDTIREAWGRVAHAVERELGVQLPPLALWKGLAGAPLEVLVRGVPVPTSGDALEPDLDEVARSHAADLLGLQEVDDLLRRVRAVAPADVAAVVPRHLDLANFRAVLVGLLREGVPITDIRSILGTLAIHAPKTSVVAELTDRARAGLCHVITHALTAGADELTPITVSPVVEDMLRSGIRDREDGPVMVLPPRVRAEILDAAREVLEDGDVVLTIPEVRRHLRAMLAPAFPGVSVISHDELTSAVVVHPKGELRVGR